MKPIRLLLAATSPVWAAGCLAVLAVALLLAGTAHGDGGNRAPFESACTDANLDSNALGLCVSYCDAMDCTEAGIANGTACEAVKSEYLTSTGHSSLPCERPKTCKCLDPALLFERISKISEPDYICYADTDYTPYTYVEYIVESGGVPQIGMGMEDQFDGSWYCYYFEYQPGSEGELPEFFRYDLTADDVNACRAALEPPFVCPAP